MLNYYELMNVIDINDHYAIYKINQAMADDICEALKTIKATAKNREEAFKKYTREADFNRDETVPGLYGTCTSIFYNPAIKYETPFIRNYHDVSLSILNNKTYIYEDLQGAAALAKCLGYKAGKTDYIIDIDGNIFSWDIVYSVYSMIAVYGAGKMDKTECYLSSGNENEPKYFLGGKKALVIRSQEATGIVLPIIGKGPGMIDVSFKNYNKFRKGLEARELEAMKKEA